MTPDNPIRIVALPCVLPSTPNLLESLTSFPSLSRAGTPPELTKVCSSTRPTQRTTKPAREVENDQGWIWDSHSDGEGRKGDAKRVDHGGGGGRGPCRGEILTQPERIRKALNERQVVFFYNKPAPPGIYTLAVQDSLPV